MSLPPRQRDNSQDDTPYLADEYFLDCWRDPPCGPLFGDPSGTLLGDPDSWPTHFCDDEAWVGVHGWASARANSTRLQDSPWVTSWPLPVGWEAYVKVAEAKGWQERPAGFDTLVPFDGEEMAALILPFSIPGAEVTFFGLVNDTESDDPDDFLIADSTFIVVGRDPASDKVKDLIERARRWWRQLSGQRVQLDPARRSRGGRRRTTLEEDRAFFRRLLKAYNEVDGRYSQKWPTQIDVLTTLACGQTKLTDFLARCSLQQDESGISWARVRWAAKEFSETGAAPEVYRNRTE